MVYKTQSLSATSLTLFPAIPTATLLAPHHTRLAFTGWARARSSTCSLLCGMFPSTCGWSLNSAHGVPQPSPNFLCRVTSAYLFTAQPTKQKVNCLPVIPYNSNFFKNKSIFNILKLGIWVWVCACEKLAEVRCCTFPVHRFHEVVGHQIKVLQIKLRSSEKTLFIPNHQTISLAPQTSFLHLFSSH